MNLAHTTPKYKLNDVRPHRTLKRMLEDHMAQVLDDSIAGTVNRERVLNEEDSFAPGAINTCAIRRSHPGSPRLGPGCWTAQRPPRP
jgi:hypothetical protein